MLDIPIEPLAPEPKRPAVGQGPLLLGGLVALLLTLVAVAMLVGLSPDAQRSTPQPPPSAAPAKAPGPSGLRVEELPRERSITITAADMGVAESRGSSRGCGQKSSFTGTREVTHPQGIDVVEWLMHVPDDYSENDPHPLVIMLHDDSGDSARSLLASTGFPTTADEFGFLIAAPNDDDIAYPWTDEEDITLVDEVVRLTTDMFCVDQERIFLIGNGGGGWGVDELSCRDWVAGVAFSAFTLEQPTFSCDPARAVPALTILPMDSGFMPPDGGPDCVNNSKLGFDQFESMWGERNDCGSSRTRHGRHEGGTCVDWGCETPYLACRVEGGRRWAGAPERAVDLFGCDGPANTFPFNETVWTFFASIVPE